ncbi:type II toxin-antitoxin system YafQ family toxin [Paludisphaera mucosa]|uniref:Type II toxin-antitoxin system YafQ family toxin n=1 Tax=Paludisphaera mucosa TaxID=3030827 RepID=A0ABT6FL02_9BACT|nr:type II toxin-antitoxin system YafQ family toxin [Paludisphaera mucosa]MDG3008253.1 type II toxin-antitoxin system YafQ family toxin [Paludisphaera mucosa]
MARRRKADRREDEPTPAPRPPLTPSLAVRFKRDVRLLESRGKDMAKLRAVMAAIIERRPLDRSRVDHALSGPWKGCRDCHVEPDWILIYELSPTEVVFHRTGTHADLF